MTDKNKELAELFGIEAKCKCDYGLCNFNYQSRCPEANHMYPDFEKPDNFMNLFSIIGKYGIPLIFEGLNNSYTLVSVYLTDHEFLEEEKDYIAYGQGENQQKALINMIINLANNGKYFDSKFVNPEKHTYFKNMKIKEQAQKIDWIY